MNPLTDSRRAIAAARHIYTSFQQYQTGFADLTAQAGHHFAERDWLAQRQTAINRLDLYNHIITPLTQQLRDYLAPHHTDKYIWISMKAVYSSLIENHDDCELAETFFNSVTRRVFTTVGVDPRIEFVNTDFATVHPPEQMLYDSYSAHNELPHLIEQILRRHEPLHGAYADLTGDAALIADHIRDHLQQHALPRLPGRIEMLREPFYRGMSAYLVGRMIAGGQVIPLVLSLLHEESGVIVDAVLLEEDSVSILFSFARSYFHVRTPRPYDLIQFLRTIMPRKRVAELYIAIGYNKHGKTELYRDFLRYLANSNDQFLISRGQRGMVMVVFDLPGYDMVFKVIKDRFDRPKKSTPEQVKDKYAWVFRQDRAGRLVDAQEFEHLAISRARFAPELLAELGEVARNTVVITAEQVIIKHCYIERKVIPLDVYLRQATAVEAEQAIINYGQTVKDLAYTNIFTGDMLLKNFGVTRHGRVVFYDYDELSHLLDGNFRHLPQASHYDDDLADTPWFPVGDHDIFPEEFIRFMGLPPQLKKIFRTHHADLFDPTFWQQIQEQIRQGRFLHIYPYTPAERLR